MGHRYEERNERRRSQLLGQEREELRPLDGAHRAPDGSNGRASDAVRGAEKVLEVGAGTGLVTVGIAAAVGKLVATDSAAAILEQRVQAAGLKNVQCEQANLYALRFDEGTFDAVVAANVLHLVPDVQGALAALKRDREEAAALVNWRALASTATPLAFQYRRRAEGGVGHPGHPSATGGRLSCPTLMLSLLQRRTWRSIVAARGSDAKSRAIRRVLDPTSPPSARAAKFREDLVGIMTSPGPCTRWPQDGVVAVPQLASTKPHRRSRQPCTSSSHAAAPATTPGAPRPRSALSALVQILASNAVTAVRVRHRLKCRRGEVDRLHDRRRRRREAQRGA